MRTYHPAWRLSWYEHGALVASFLHRAYLARRTGAIAEADLIEALEDDLHRLRGGPGNATARKKTASNYLNEWAGPERGWLRKFYRTGSDEPYFDLTPATEKAIDWIGNLADRT